MRNYIHVEARGILKSEEGEVDGAVGGGDGSSDRGVRVLLSPGNDVGDGVELGVGRNGDGDDVLRQTADRSQHGERVVIQLLQIGHGHVAAGTVSQAEGVAVGIGRGDLHGAGDAAAAGDVGDDQGLIAVLAPDGLDSTAEQVGRAAGAVGDDHVNGLLGLPAGSLGGLGLRSRRLGSSALGSGALRSRRLGGAAAGREGEQHDHRKD